MVRSTLGAFALRLTGPVAREGGSALGDLGKGLTIMWREPRVTIGSLVRLINTAPNFALFVVAPFFFTQTVGFSQAQYLQIVTIVYTANIFANLFFGMLGDRLGWRNTVLWFGCVMSGVGVLLLYYVPLAVGPNFWLTVLCWAVFGIGLAGFVPLTALVPALVTPQERGSALAVYTLAAGLSSFIGPAMIGLLGGYQHLGVIMWAFFGMYILGAVLTVTLRSPEDPVHRGAAARQEREAPVGG